MYYKLSLISLSPASCAVDLNVGSERGEYVSQDYILDKLNRPHRAISIMYCYYPNDIGWPIRASIAHKKENIDLRLNTEVTPDYVSKIAPDVIIAALGAVPSVPAIPGIDGKNVLSVTDCYSNPEKSGDKVVILGGGLSGTELAVYLTKHLGRSCTIMEMEPQLGNGGNRIHAMALDVEIKQNSIDVQTGTKCVKITSEGAYGEKDGETKLYPADTVVNALGLKARDREAADLSLCAPEFYLIGDCNTPRNIFMTTNEATHVATDIGRPFQ